MLYNPKTEAPVGKFSWAEIAEMIGDDFEMLTAAMELFHRQEGMLLSRLLSSAQNRRRHDRVEKAGAPNRYSADRSQDKTAGRRPDHYHALSRPDDRFPAI